MHLFKEYCFKKNGDSEIGYLVAIESMKDIPFEIKRVYYVFGVPNNLVRGKHAHRNLEQILICISGKIKLKLSDGYTQESIELYDPGKAIYIGKNIWREIYDFSSEAVMLVMASEHYKDTESIYDYNQFLRLRGTHI